MWAKVKTTSLDYTKEKVKQRAIFIPHKRSHKTLWRRHLGVGGPLLFGAAYKRNVGQSLLFKTMSGEHTFIVCGLCAEHRERDASSCVHFRSLFLKRR
jgi:hypothetical protein